MVILYLYLSASHCNFFFFFFFQRCLLLLLLLLLLLFLFLLSNHILLLYHFFLFLRFLLSIDIYKTPIFFPLQHYYSLSPPSPAPLPAPIPVPPDPTPPALLAFPAPFAAPYLLPEGDLIFTLDGN